MEIKSLITSGDAYIQINLVYYKKIVPQTTKELYSGILMSMLMGILNKTRRENKAVAGVLEALLIIAMLVVVICIIQTQYIPQIMEQREAEHMEQVSNQFSYLKSMIDIQALTGTMETDVLLRNIPMLSYITLGSRKLPYLISAPSYGELSLENTGAKINSNPPIPGKNDGINFSSIIYRAYNIYFPKQTYILEGGCIILNQNTGKPVIRAPPSISVKKVGGDIDMLFYLPNINDVPGKDYSSGLGGCPIRTNYSGYQPYPTNLIPIGGYIVLYSDYLNAWNQSLNNIFREVMYDSGDKPTPENKTVDISITQHVGKDVVKITPLKYPISLELKVVDIKVQIGKGYIDY